MLLETNRCFTWFPEVAPPPPPTFLLAPQNMCFAVFELLGYQKRRVFVCLGRNGSDGQACHVPGASSPSKSYQRLTKGMLWRSLFVIVSEKNDILSVKVRRSLFRCWHRNRKQINFAIET